MLYKLGCPLSLPEIIIQQQSGVHSGFHGDGTAPNARCRAGMSNLVMITFSLLESFNFALSSNSSCEKLHLEGLKCLKAIMNNKVGLKNLFDHSEALILLAR